MEFNTEKFWPFKGGQAFFESARQMELFQAD